MNKEFFYISNLLSMSRFLLTAICIILLINNNFLLTMFMIIIIWITDLLDGFFARRRNEISELGKIIDPLADKTAIILIAAVMVFKGLLPVWFFVIVVLRDLLILSGGVYLKSQRNIVLQSNAVGKFTAFLIGFCMLVYLLKNINTFLPYHSEFTELLLMILLLLCLVMIVFSIISYLTRFIRAFNRRV